MNFKTSKKRYMDLADAKSANNDLLNSFMFLVLVGALSHRRGIIVDRHGIKDLRVHPMVIQNSRTGKGESLKVLAKACEFCNLEYTDETQFTDAGIVGQVDNSIANKNRQKGYIPGDPEYVEPITIGDLGTYDVVSFSEGKQMIKLNAYSDDKLEILQSAMDTPGKIRKKLSNEIPIEFECNACLVGTTYFLDDFEKIFLEQGIFQRMLVCVRNFTIEDRELLNDRLATQDPPVSSQDFDDELMRFCKDLKAQIDKMPENTIITFDDSGKETLKRRLREWSTIMKKDFKGKELNIISSYTTSCLNLYCKVAALSAVLNGSTVVTMKEMSDAHVYMRSYMKSIMREVLTKISGIDSGALERLIIGHVKRQTKFNNAGDVVDGVTIEEINSIVQAKYHDISESRIRSVIRDNITNNVLQEAYVSEGGKKVKKIAMR